MSRLVLGSGAALVVIGLCIFLWKAIVLGLPLVPTHPDGLWSVELEIAARFAGGPGSVRIAVPTSGPGQRVSAERVVSHGLEYSVREEVGRRVGIWRGRPNGVAQLRHAFHVEVEKRRFEVPEGPLEEVPEAIARLYLSPTPNLPSDAGGIRDLLERLQPPGLDDGAGRLRTLFAFVADEISLEEDEASDALLALEAWTGSELGKSRLLAALLRTGEIPSRVVSGLALRAAAPPQEIYWVEAWLDSWIPMSPSRGFLGQLPDDWIALSRDDGELVEATGAVATSSRYRAARERLGADELATLMRPPNALVAKLSLFRLPVATQEALRLLLLLPLGAVGTALFRNVVGIPTFGTFMPILVALALRATTLGTGAVILGAVIGLGILSRLWIERLHLLLVPRLCVLLCVVVLGLVGFALMGAEFERGELFGGALLPVVILVMLIERFSITVAEEGTREAAQRLAWTAGVALAIYPVFRSTQAEHLMFGFPELVLVTMGLLFWIGGYTGYRLSELLRFRSLATDDSGGTP